MERSFWLIRKVLHIERSDRMARLLGPERSDPIGCPGDLSSSAFAGLLVLQNFRQKCLRQQETDERNASCSATKLPFALPLRATQTNDRLFLYITYSNRGGVTLLCTMLNDGAR